MEVVAKFSAGCSERGVGGLVAEALAAMLAADLELPVPEPLLVEFDAHFVAAIQMQDPEVAQLAARSVPVAFGSRHLPAGFSVIPTARPVPQALRQQACEIFAFDMLIQNPDRRPENPNCLSDGRAFAIFDHELAFLTEGVIGWRPPWVPGSLESTRRMQNHIFFRDLVGKPLDLSRVQGAWQAITHRRLREYLQMLPDAWIDGANLANSTVEYLDKTRENLDAAMVEIERVLQ